MKLDDAELVAIELMVHHGLVDWTFKFDGSKRRFGQCNETDKQISLSRKLTFLNTPERVKRTIVHEIAHALTPRHGHDKVWKEKCIEIGGDGIRRFKSNDTIMK
jgi:predicted metal-dependent hydrolase